MIFNGLTLKDVMPSIQIRKYDNITCAHKVYKSEISTVSTLIDSNRLSALTLNSVRGVADDNTFYPTFSGSFHCDIHNGTAVRIDQYLHKKRILNSENALALAHNSNYNSRRVFKVEGHELVACFVVINCFKM